jgi:hypothetical protein
MAHGGHGLQVRNGERKVRFSGTASYSDVFGRSRIHSPAGKYNPSISAFEIEKHEAP